MLFQVVVLCLAHNGVVHTPGTSSSVLVGPSDSHGYVTFNYGMNTVGRHPEWPTTLFPVAVHERADGSTFAVADNGDGFAYYVDGVAAAVENCPPPEVSKISRWGDGTYMFGLLTGTVTELRGGGCHARPDLSWPGAADWGSAWGGSLNTESPLFYGAHLHDGCMWYATRDGAVQIQTRHCNLGYVSPPLNDGCDGTCKEFHEGGAFVEQAGVLYWLNGETGFDLLRSTQQLNRFAGKVLLLDGGGLEIVGTGFRHPWTAVSLGDQVAIADVGHASVEEVTVTTLTRGQNFGWPL